MGNPTADNEPGELAPDTPVWAIGAPGTTSFGSSRGGLGSDQVDPQWGSPVPAAEGLPHQGGHPAPSVPPAQPPAPGQGSGRRGTLMMIGLTVAAVAAGALAVTVYQSATADPSATASASSPVGEQQGTQPVVPGAGTSPGAVPVPGQGNDGGQRGGGVAGEQRVTGTLTAVSSSTITVKSTAGTLVYQVDPGTEIVRNGTRSTLAQLAVGDPVFVHVIPLGDKPTAERIFAGTLPADGPGIGPGPDGGGPGQGPDDQPSAVSA